MDSALLAPLIEATYDTALDPSSWPRVMRMVTDVLRGSCSSLVMSDAEQSAFPFEAHDLRIPPETIADYLAHFASIDTVRASGANAPVGVVQTEEDFLGPETAMVYNEFYARWDWGHILGTYLFRQGPVVATLSVYRSGGWSAFSDNDRRVAARIAGHLSRAVQIQHKLAAANNERDMICDAMERLAVGVVFVDGNGRILLMNRAAREITSERDGLSNDRGELIGSTAASTRKIRDIIGAALRQSIDNGGGPDLALQRPSGRRPYVLLASPIRTQLSIGSSTKVLILITDTDREVPQADETLRAIYALSRSEAALAIALCEGRTLKEIAFARSVSINTIHTQLASVQRKVGANRQTEIVSVLLRGPLGILRREGET